MKPAYRFWLALAGILLSSVPCAQAFSVTYTLGTEYHVHESTCPAGDGHNYLTPDPFENMSERFLMDDVSQDVKDELNDGDWDFGTWNYSWSGAELAGVMTVDVYKSRFYDTHVSGGEILIRYNRGTGDPTNLQWIQLVRTTDPIDPPGELGPPSGPYIDPFPNDDPGADPSTQSGGAPFYYHDEESQTPPTDYGTFDLYNSTGMFGAYDLLFYDWSRRPHPPDHWVTWKAELYLVSVSGTDITFHHGIEWGWRGGCGIPEPATLWMLGTGLVMLGGGYARRRIRIDDRNGR